MTTIMQKPFVDTICPHCKFGILKLPSSGQEWHVICNECQAITFCYVPMDHQELFHKDEAKFRMWAGGFGSAKTSTCAAEMVRHCLETPNGMCLIGAQTYPQLEETAKKMFMDMMPQELVLNYEKQKNKLTLINGHVVLFRSFDDEGKIRSLNLTAFWIEEASEIKYEIFTQLQTRLRSHATDHHIGILSTNPDLNWIRGEFLLKSARIEGSDGRYWVEEEDKNPNFSTHIAPTHLNKYLPKTYYNDTAKGKPKWWIDRYLNGSFEHSEGQVYPIFNEAIVDPFPIPKNWQRLGAADFGLRDPTVLIMGAIDPEEGIVYLYHEYFETSHAVPHHAHNMKLILGDIPHGSLQKLVADPSGKRNNISDNRSIFDHYAEYDIWFQPGDNRIEPGIGKVYAYLQLGKLKVFSSLRHTIREHINYKYKPQELRTEKNLDEKPIDKDNHTCDSVRYMIQELPDNPKDLIQKSYNPRDFNNRIVKTNLPHQLQADDNPYSTRRDDWYNNY